MVTTPETTAFDRGVRPILQIVLLDKADAVLNFRPDPELQARIEVLATKSTEGELTAQERAEYEGYVRANKSVAILQRQARQFAGITPYDHDSYSDGRIGSSPKTSSRVSSPGPNASG